MVYSREDDDSILMFTRQDAVNQIDDVITRLGKTREMTSHREIGEAVVESFLELGVIEFPAEIQYRCQCGQARH